MKDQLLHAEPYGSLYLAPEVPCIVIAWHGYATSEQLRALMNKGLELYQAEAARTQPLGWLGDTRHVQAVRNADHDWLLRDWSGRALQAGIRHIGFVVPESVFGQLTVQTYSSNVADDPRYPIVTSEHTTLRAAKAWLRAALHPAG